MKKAICSVLICVGCVACVIHGATQKSEVIIHRESDGTYSKIILVDGQMDQEIRYDRFGRKIEHSYADLQHRRHYVIL